MLYPEEMTEFELIIPAKELLAVTNVLAGEGAFQQADASSLSVEQGVGSGESWQEKTAAYGALERRIMTLMQILNIAEGAPPPASQATMTEMEALNPRVAQIEQEVQQVNRQLVADQKKLEQLENYLRLMQPVAGIDVNVTALRHPRNVYAVLGTMPAGNIERLKTSLTRIPHVLEVLRQDSRDAVVFLGGAKHNADALDRATRSAYLNPLTLPEDYEGTPAEISAALNRDIDQTRRQIAEHQAGLAKMSQAYTRELQELLWSTRTSRMLADAVAHFGRLRYTYLIVGWVPTSHVDTLRQRLKRLSNDILIETNPVRRGSARADVPVALNNPGILGAFQTLVTTYARPRYYEVDPTFLMLITFPLLFGAMFGDVGHGLVLVLGGALVASRRVKALRGFANMGVIIIACGVMATVFGFLYGSVFGVETLIPALWIRPLENILTILAVAIGGGILLLTVGFIISIINSIVARDIGRLLFDSNGIAGFVLYWSLLLLAASIALPGFPIPTPVWLVLVVISGVVIMFSEVLKHAVEGHRPLIEGGIGTYLFQAVVELFETLIRFLSNTLSYVRVGAFAVAHGGLSQVVFILAALAGGGAQGIGYWLVVILGNLFIVGFEGLIVTIQTMRLEYYEFFSKFFTGGGARYRPMAVQPATND